MIVLLFGKSANFQDGPAGFSLPELSPRGLITINK